MAISCHVPAVSMFLWQMGRRCVCWPYTYICLFSSVFSFGLLPMWDSAYVSGTVTSQAIGFPLAHGKRVVPSGRLLSSRMRFIGSLAAGDWARLTALYRMSFKWLWRCCLEALLRQDSSCRPHASTATSVWFTGFRSQATASLMASSDSLSPTAVIGVESVESVERPQQEVWLYPRQMELGKGLVLNTGKLIVIRSSRAPLENANSEFSSCTVNKFQL